MIWLIISLLFSYGAAITEYQTHKKDRKSLDILYWKVSVDADPWDGHLLEDVRRYHGASRILR
jgi:hypothetical protein